MDDVTSSKRECVLIHACIYAYLLAFAHACTHTDAFGEPNQKKSVLSMCVCSRSRVCECKRGSRERRERERERERIELMTLA